MPCDYLTGESPDRLQHSTCKNPIQTCVDAWCPHCVQCGRSEASWHVLQAREGEFRVPHQEQPNLDPYTSHSNDEEVRYPTIGQRKPAAQKVANVVHCMIIMLCVFRYRFGPSNTIQSWLGMVPETVTA